MGTWTQVLLPTLLILLPLSRLTQPTILKPGLSLFSPICFLSCLFYLWMTNYVELFVFSHSFPLICRTSFPGDVLVHSRQPSASYTAQTCYSKDSLYVLSNVSMYKNLFSFMTKWFFSTFQKFRVSILLTGRMRKKTYKIQHLYMI